MQSRCGNLRSVTFQVYQSLTCGDIYAATKFGYDLVVQRDDHFREPSLEDVRTCPYFFGDRDWRRVVILEGDLDWRPHRCGDWSPEDTVKIVQHELDSQGLLLVM